MINVREISSKVHKIFAISPATDYLDLVLLISDTMVQKIFYLVGLFVLPKIEIIQFILPNLRVKSEMLDQSSLFK